MKSILLHVSIAALPQTMAYQLRSETKLDNMGRDHLGHPSGANKNEEGTGIPTRIFVDDPEKDHELTERYTNDEREIADDIRQNNPNRNTDKDNATNAGGYKGGT